MPGDIRIWINLLCQSDMIYLTEPLSSVRIHENQQKNQVEYKKNAQEGQVIIQKILSDLGITKNTIPDSPITTI